MHFRCQNYAAEPEYERQLLFIRGHKQAHDTTYTALCILLLLCHLFGIFRFICL